jgi:hypothetical protein
VVLSDALTLACEEGAERIIDFATLTGAARIALGEDLPPIYARDTASVRAIQDLSFETEDPLWHMPLFEPYRKLIQPAIADISNTGTSKMGAALPRPCSLITSSIQASTGTISISTPGTSVIAPAGPPAVNARACVPSGSG